MTHSFDLIDAGSMDAVTLTAAIIVNMFIAAACGWVGWVAGSAASTAYWTYTKIAFAAIMVLATIMIFFEPPAMIQTLVMTIPALLGEAAGMLYRRYRVR